jgi:hypothetical protein
MKNLLSFQEFINEAVDSKMIQKAISISGNMSLTGFGSDYASDLEKVLNAKRDKIYSILTSDHEESVDLSSSDIKVLDDLQKEIMSKGKKIRISGAKDAYQLGNIVMINSGISGEPYEIYAVK